MIDHPQQSPGGRRLPSNQGVTPHRGAHSPVAAAESIVEHQQGSEAPSQATTRPHRHTLPSPSLPNPTLQGPVTVRLFEQTSSAVPTVGI